MTSSDNGSPVGIVLTYSSALVEKQDLVLIFELLTLLTISLALGRNLTSFVGFLLFLYWVSQKLHIYISDLARAQAAKKAAQAKEAQERRSREVTIITAATGHNVVQIYQQEKTKLDGLKTSLKRREAALRAKEELIAMKEVEMTKVEAAQLAKSQELRKKEKELVKQEKKFAETQKIAMTTMKESARNRDNKMIVSTVSGSSTNRSKLFSLSFPFSEYDPLGSGFTCIGQTKEHRRCRATFLSNYDKECAANRLRLMRSSDPGNSFELNALTELAGWMLCPRWHKPQCDAIARQWDKDLLTSVSALESSKRIQQTPPSAHLSPASAGSGKSNASSVFSSTGRGSTGSISPISRSLTPSSDAEFWESAVQSMIDRPGRDPSRNLAPVFKDLSNRQGPIALKCTEQEVFIHF